MCEEILTFITAQRDAPLMKSRWFETDVLNVYLRAGPAFSNSLNAKANVLVISNVSVVEDRRREGIFSGFFTWLLKNGAALGYDELQIENAISPEMINFCETRNLQIKHSPYCNVHSYWTKISAPENHRKC